MEDIIREPCVINISEMLPDSVECGCTYPHERTVKAVLIGEIENSLEKITNYKVKPPYAVLCDDITYHLLGRKVAEYLKADNFILRGLFDEHYWLSKLNSYHTIIGVGGGTILDTAKYIAYKLSSPYIAIPTAPSNDGILSPVAVVFTEEGRKTFMARSPLVAIFDLNVLKSAPFPLIASGFGDALAKITSLKDWELGRDEKDEAYCITAERYILTGINLALKGLDYFREGIIEMQGLKNLIYSLIDSGIAMMLTYSSRPATGSEHLIGRYIELKYSIPHGVASAIGTIIAAKIHQLYNPHWWSEKSYSHSSIKKYCERIGILITFKESKVPTEELVNAVINAPKFRPERYTILHKVKLDREEVENIVKTAMDPE